MPSTPDTPNVLLIHGHDMGRWLSCYGLPNVPTPNLEAFGDTAIVFEQAFSAAPLCTPSRGAMLTGLLPHANGLNGLSHDSWLYFDDVRTLPEYLSDLGYLTTLVGLQHENPDPLVLGYEQVRGLGFLPRSEPVVDATLEWLAEQDGARPWFCNVGCWEAHRPWPETDYVPADPATVHVPAYLPDNEYTRADIAAMYGALAQFDENFGRLLAEVDDETLVIVTTDHGVPFPRAKSTLLDSGVGVTLIVRPPRSWAVAPRREHAMVSHLDLVPTLVELAGGERRPEWDGVSLVGLLKRDEPQPERELVFEKTYHDGYDPARALRTVDRKYIRYFAPGPRLALAKDLEASLTRQGMGDAHLEPREMEEFYDLTVDPDELTNLSIDEGFADQVADFRERLTVTMRDGGDELIDGDIAPMPHPQRPTRSRP